MKRNRLPAACFVLLPCVSMAGSWSSSKLVAPVSEAEGVEVRFDDPGLASDEALAGLVGAGFVLLTPGNTRLETHEDYNRWVSWVHRVARQLGPRADTWILVSPPTSAGIASRTNPLFGQWLKSSATELRATDPGSKVIWQSADGSPEWPQDAMAYLDGIAVRPGTSLAAIRERLPRGDFQLWLEEQPDAVPLEQRVASWLTARQAGATTLFRPAAAQPEATALLASLVLPDWEGTDAIEVKAPAGRHAFVLLDGSGREVRVVVLGSGAGELRLGLGRPRELRWRGPSETQTQPLQFRSEGAWLILPKLPERPVLVLDLVGASPLIFEASTTAISELSGDELMARAEAHAFRLRRLSPHVACRLRAHWQSGEELGYLEAELLFETGSSTAWMHLLAERKNGLPFDPNRERFLFFQRGGGVSTPLIQFVDEEHDYTRLPDQTVDGRRRLVVGFQPRPDAAHRTSGQYWLDPENYAILKVEVDDPSPGFPLTHEHSVTEFSAQSEGLNLPSVSITEQTGTIFGFPFSTESRMEFDRYTLRPSDLQQRIQKAVQSTFPLLIWNEARDEMIVLRKKSKSRQPKLPQPASSQAAADELLRFSFGQGLEGAEPEGKGDLAASNLQELAQKVGGVEVLRGGDPKKIKVWAFGVTASEAGTAPLLLYTYLNLEWKGHQDWQLAIVTAGVFTAIRWTDAHLLGSAWSGSLTALLPLFVPTDGNEEEPQDLDLQRWVPALSASARRPLGKSLGLELGVDASYHYFRASVPSGLDFRIPTSHFELVSYLQVDWKRPSTTAFLRAENGWRSRWEAWGFGTDAAGSNFTRLQGGLSRTFRFGQAGVMQGGLQAGQGWNLDQFSAFSLDSVGGQAGTSSRIVLPVDGPQGSRYVGVDGLVETLAFQKLRLGLEVAYLKSSDEDVVTIGLEQAGRSSEFASGGVTSQFNFYWKTRALLRLGWSAELGEGELPSGPYLSFVLTKDR